MDKHGNTFSRPQGTFAVFKGRNSGAEGDLHIETVSSSTSSSSSSSSSDRATVNTNGTTSTPYSSPNSLLISRRSYPLSALDPFIVPALSVAVNTSPSLDTHMERALLRLSGSRFHSVADSSPIRRSSSAASTSSPLSPMDNCTTPPSRSSAMYNILDVTGEDVLVMDGILVNERLTGTRGKLLDSASSSTGSNYSCYKTEICRSWEDSGRCRYASKCQFAHGKEELRPARHKTYRSEESTRGAFKFNVQRKGLSQLNAVSKSAVTSPSDNLNDTIIGLTTDACKMKSSDELLEFPLVVGPIAPMKVNLDMLTPEQIALSNIPTDEIMYNVYGSPRRSRPKVFEDICKSDHEDKLKN